MQAEKLCEDKELGRDMARRVLTGEKLEKELERLSLMREFERQYEDCAFICGIDEAGRGPLAGSGCGRCGDPAEGLPDPLSERLERSSLRAGREELFLEIKEKAIAWSVGIVGPERIDEINILQATYEAMRQAIAKLDPAPQVLLNDAVTIPRRCDSRRCRSSRATRRAFPSRRRASSQR